MLIDTLPSIIYGNNKLTNLVKNWEVFNNGKDIGDIFYQYDLENGKSAQSLALELYGKPYYDSIIYIINDVINPFNDWFKNPSEFKLFVDKKYGDKLYDIKWYRDLKSGFILDDVTGATASEVEPVTNFDYEYAKNDKMRVIYVLDSRYLSYFLKNVRV